MRAMLIALVAAAVGGCTPAPRDISLTGLNLADNKTLSAIQARLTADDRAALGTYALLHWPQSKFYCGEPIGGQASAAATIGEAIDQTRAYEEALERVQAKARMTAALAKQSEERALIAKLERVIFERDRLFSRLGPAALSSAEGRALSARLETFQAELSALRGTAAP